MANSTVTSVFAGNIPGVATFTVDTSTINVGETMVIFSHSAPAGVVISIPSGWIELFTQADMNTRHVAGWAKLKTSAGETSVVLTAGASTVSWSIVLLKTKGADLANWVKGALWFRGSHATPSTNIAPSIDTPKDNSLVLCVSFEATNSMESPNDIAGINNGFGEVAYRGQLALNDRIETIYVGSKLQPVAGPTGDTTITYQYAQTSNGAAIMIALPTTDDSWNISGAPTLAGSTIYTTFDLTGTGALPYTINLPSGITVGNYVMIFLRIQSPTVAATPTVQGFDQVGNIPSLPSAGPRYNAVFAKKIASGSDIPTSSTTITIDQSALGSNRVIAVAFRLSNVDLTNPIVAAAGASFTSNGTTVTRPSYTSEAGALDIFYGASEFSSPNSNIPTVEPSGYTMFAEGTNPIGGATTTSRTYVYLGYQVLNSPTVPQASISWDVTAGSAAGGISIRAMSTVVPVGTVVKVGTGVAAYLSYIDGEGTRVAPASVGVWYPSYPSVSALLTDSAAHPTIAHRGGSANYPEFSEYAYDHAVMRGHGVLEFSCGWTSDLVPFGLGAQYLDAAAGLTPGTNLDPTTITWTTLVSTYQNKWNPVSAGVYQPFYRLVDFLTKYTPTHIVCVDPKFGFATTTKVTAMLDICDAHGGPSRVIIKFDSPTTNTILTTAAHTRGYKCMNYWGTDITSLGSQQSNWDILGYAYNGTPTDWTTVLGYGKPTWAAVIPDAAGVATATASGAGLMMIKDVKNIPPSSDWN